MKRCVKPSSRRLLGFSLVELMMVIFISTILLFAGMGMFRSSRGEAVKTGTEKLSAMIEQARVAAITSRRPVALVLVEPGSGEFDDGACRLGMFALEEWSDDQVVRGDQMERWAVLPVGMAFFGGAVEGLENVVDQTPIEIEGEEGEFAGIVPALVFSARGGLLSPPGSESVVLSMGSGTYQSGRAIATTEGGQRAIRVGRVAARAWNLDQ
ncbi:MAG: pilus assembly FimT family protein [Verrucomicrobiales bacterium]